MPYIINTTPKRPKNPEMARVLSVFSPTIANSPKATRIKQGTK